MLQYDAAPVVRRLRWLKNLANNLGVLVNDRGERDHVDDTIQTALLCMVEGEAQACQGLAATGGHGQGIDASRAVSSLPAVVRNILPQTVNRPGWQQALQIDLKPLDQDRPCGVIAARPKRLGSAVLKIGRVDAIGVDQTAEEQTHDQATLLSRHSKTCRQNTGVVMLDVGK